MVLWTSSILWFVRRNCALRESLDSEESVSGSGKLQTDALGVDVVCLATSPEGAWSNSSESRGRSSIGWITGGCPYGDTVAPAWVRKAA
ncbi:hypothetical protein B296_00058921 [Ensete ventricosum]|uniref:Secreted protein n=1 Tax=Ensete ventricosum TaxID=4639 RepID=A0A426X540_ENSVE|nr:hypothetical protein B296_00058921 [Ensete ventricosum]